MIVNTDTMFSVTEANQNFSRVTRPVDKSGMAVILKNNKPKYVLVDFAEYGEVQAVRRKKVEAAADQLIGENLEAFRELAK